MSSAPDHIVRDLSNKAADDTHAAIERTARLLSDPNDMFGVALGACAAALGLATGFSHLGYGKELTPEQLVDGLWSVLRPMALKACGGSPEPFRQMIADLNAREVKP